MLNDRIRCKSYESPSLLRRQLWMILSQLSNVDLNDQFIAPLMKERTVSPPLPVLKMFIRATGGHTECALPATQKETRRTTIRPGCSIRVAVWQLEIPPVGANSNVTVVVAGVLVRDV